MSVSSSPSTSLYSGPRRLKYTSNTVSNAAPVGVVLDQRRTERVLERVAVFDRDVLRPLPSRRGSPSAMTGSPALRSSMTKPWSRSSIESTPGSTAGRLRRSSFGRLGDVGLVLEQHVERLACCASMVSMPSSISVRAQSMRLGDRRRLLEVELADRADDAGDLVGELLVDLGHRRARSPSRARARGSRRAGRGSDA